jgi:hypothetical protein
MAYTYSKISTYTVGSGGIPSVTFLNIPQNYTDLVIKISARTNFAGISDYIYMSLNGNTSNNYYLKIEGNGSTVGSYSGSGQTNSTNIGTANGATATANTFGNSEIYIPNYTSSSAKSASNEGVAENNATAGLNELQSYLNTGTSAITSIALAPGNGPNFVQHSTFHLYGIKAEL